MLLLWREVGELRESTRKKCRMAGMVANAGGDGMPPNHLSFIVSITQTVIGNSRQL